MSKFSEKVKDFMYDATDYVLIVAIVLIVFVVITWRLDVLFAKNTDTSDGNKAAVEDDVDKNSDNKENADKDSAADSPAEEPAAPEKVTFEIPEGSLPPTVANILFENGLIEDKVTFLQKSREMELDTAFRSGTYEVDADIKDEDLIKTIARQN